MADATCSVENCERPVMARAMCSMHYQRWKTAGGQVSDLLSRSVEQRFWQYVERRSDDECWPWTGALTKRGYGVLWRINAHAMPAHRYAYELAHGDPPPVGLSVDHICHNRDMTCAGGLACLHRRCVNPAHLEAVTHGTNNLRGRGRAAGNARKTHCPQGHEYSGVNAQGSRICKICLAGQDRARRHTPHRQ